MDFKVNEMNQEIQDLQRHEKIIIYELTCLQNKINGQKTQYDQLIQKMKLPLFVHLCGIMSEDLINICISYSSMTICRCCDLLCPISLSMCRKHILKNQKIDFYGNITILCEKPTFTDHLDLEVWNYLTDGIEIQYVCRSHKRQNKYESFCMEICISDTMLKFRIWGSNWHHIKPCVINCQKNNESKCWYSGQMFYEVQISR
jgi:hypothetical protein